jgi:DHA1 family multidrug resistance protein B-like MFS transporter
VWQDRLFMLYIAASLLLFSLEMMAARYSGVRLEAELPPQQLFAYGPFPIQVDGIKMFGILSAENALIVVAFGLFVPHLIRRFQERHVLAAGILLFAVGYCTISVSNQPWVLISMMVAATVGEITWVPVNQTLLARIVPDESRSTYLAVQGLTHHLSQMMGAIAVTLGAFLSSWALSGLFLLTGLLSLLLFWRVFERLQERATLHPSTGAEQPVQG